MDVEQQERGPAERIGAVGREGGGGGGGRRPAAVELDGERDVDEHRDEVGDRERREDVIGRARRHVGPRQHDDVERVADDADRADDETRVAVVRRVPDRVCGRFIRHVIVENPNAVTLNTARSVPTAPNVKKR